MPTLTSGDVHRLIENARGQVGGSIPVWLAGLTLIHKRFITGSSALSDSGLHYSENPDGSLGLVLPIHFLDRGMLFDNYWLAWGVVERNRKSK